jgi:hypothetical protein
MPSGDDPMGGYRFSRATNAERVCAEIMLRRGRAIPTKGRPFVPPMHLPQLRIRTGLFSWENSLHLAAISYANL